MKNKQQLKNQNKRRVTQDHLERARKSCSDASMGTEFFMVRK